MSTGGEKFVLILDIHICLNSNLKKLIFVELELELVSNYIRELELAIKVG